MQSKMVLMLAVVFGLIVTSSVFAASEGYQIMDLGTSFTARGLNSQGQVIGITGSITNGNGIVIWQNEQSAYYSKPQNSSLFEVVGITDSGQVIANGGSPEGRKIYKFSNGSWDMWPVQGNGSMFGFAKGFNNNNQIVGYRSVNGGRAFWLNNTTYTSLPSLGGRDWWANEINNNGIIVGWSDASNGMRYACMWDNNLNIINLGIDGHAIGINDNLQIIGNVAGDAFLWESNNHMILPNLGEQGYSRSGVGAINNLGQIVGWSYPEQSTVHHAVLWEDGEILDLNTFLPSDSEWETLSSAIAINDNGWILGSGRINDESHTFLMMPVPEPGSFLLFGISIAIVGRKRF